MFGIISFGRGSTDFGIPGFSAEVETLQFGIGFHTAVSPGMDLYGTLAIVDAEASATGFYPETLDGHAIQVGVRNMASDQIEIDVAMHMVDLEDLDSDTSFRFGAVFNAADNVGVGLSYQSGDDFNGILFGVRLYL